MSIGRNGMSNIDVVFLDRACALMVFVILRCVILQT